MTEMPMVVCIMLVNGRPEMVRRAIKCWDAQTYPADRRRLVGWDSGSVSFCGDMPECAGLIWQCDPWANRHSIGALRNAANRYAVDRLGGAEILLAHWDSDDYSHPRRLEEQVEFLQDSGRPVVGYNEMLFWNTDIIPMKHTTAPHAKFPLQTCVPANEAWLYSNPNPAQPLGTSLLYTAAAWERHQFGDYTRPHTGRSAGGEDTDFLAIVAREMRPGPRGVSSLAMDKLGPVGGPRMIASLHGDNTSSRITHNVPEWHRVPEWDVYCRTKMEGK